MASMIVYIERKAMIGLKQYGYRQPIIDLVTYQARFRSNLWDDDLIADHEYAYRILMRPRNPILRPISRHNVDIVYH